MTTSEISYLPSNNLSLIHLRNCDTVSFQSHEYTHKPHKPKEHSTTHRPQYQYHSHHHQVIINMS